MPLALTLSVRTWAALDAALTFFRLAPAEVPAAQPLARPCRKLHRYLRQAGIRSGYLQVGVAGSGKALLRLQLAAAEPAEEAVMLLVPPGIAKGLARACLTMMEVHAAAEGGPFLEYEVEELQAARSYLSELHRQTDGALGVKAARRRRCSLRWDARHQEYRFTDLMAYRVHQLYRRVGASPN